MNTHCTKCGTLRPDERFLRMQARAVQGLGRGGGFFERSDPNDRREASQDDLGLDDFGRRRTKAGDREGASPAEFSPQAQVEIAPARSSSGPRNGLTSAGKPPSKAERQKAALERLRNPKRVTAALSPPRTRVYPEKSSRSRSREKKTGGFIISGGIR